MAVINDPTVAANITRVGEVATGATGALHMTMRPIPASVGHYRVNHRCVLVATQAANSRLYEIRNSHASNLIITTRLLTKWMSSSAHTAFIEDSLDVFKCTSFSVVDTTNTVTPSVSAKRTSMAATNASIRGVTVAGAAAGMTGGTLTKDGTSVGQHPKILPQTVEATTETSPRTPDVVDHFDDVNGTYPFVFIQNEGLIIENRVVLGAAAGSSVYIDHSFAEVTAY